MAGLMEISSAMARKGDTPEYVRRMQLELFDVLSKARNRGELHDVEPVTHKVVHARA